MKRTRVQTILCGFAVAACVTTAHCMDTTGGQRTTFSVVVRGDGNDTVSSLGWTIHYEQAAIVLGQMRWYEGEPLFGCLRGLRFGVAQAHPGHYVAGESLADTAGQHVVDLLAANGSDPIAVDGVTHTANSAAIDLAPPDASVSDAAALTHQQTLWVRGTATKDGVTVGFEGGLTLTESVKGVPAHGEITVEPAVWQLVITLPLLVDRVDFSTFSSGTYTDLTGAPQSDNAFTRGVTNGGAYRFSPEGTR